MKPKRSLFLLAVIPIAALIWAMKSAASWRPQLLFVQSNADYPYCTWDGRLLFVDSIDNTSGFTVWNLETRQLQWKSNGLDKFIAVAPHKHWVAVAHGDVIMSRELTNMYGVNLKICDERDGHVVRALQSGASSEKARLLAYDFSPDEKQFRIITTEALQRWDIATGRLIGNHKWNHPLFTPQLTTASFFRRDEKILVLIGKEISVLDARSGKTLRTLPGSYQPPRNSSKWNALNLSPDDQLFYETLDGTDTSRIFRTSDGKQLWLSSDWLTFGGEARIVFVPSTNGLDVFDAPTGRKLRHLPGPKTYGFDTSPDGNWIYEAREGKIYRWRAR